LRPATPSGSRPVPCRGRAVSPVAGGVGARCFAALWRRGTAAPAAHSLQGSAALDRLVLDASAAAMHGDLLEGLRRALKALGRSLVVGAAPTTASFDGSAGVVVVAGDLYRGPAARESRARPRVRVGYVGVASRAGRPRLLPVLVGATSSRATSTRGPSSGARGSRARSRVRSGHVGVASRARRPRRSSSARRRDVAYALIVV